MNRPEAKFGLIWRFVACVACVAVLWCVSSLVTGRLWLTAPHGRDPARPALRFLVLEGHDLHASLETRQLDSIRDLPTGAELLSNPSLSNDAGFVAAIARGGSQGRLDGDGMRAALYARYETDENEVGCYGLEAKTKADADQREKLLREIWAYNARLDRASVYRQGLVLLVLWHDGVSPACWESVNSIMTKQLNNSQKS